MKRNELTIVAVIGVVALAVGFWLLILAPKRNQASGLQRDVDGLRSELSSAQQEADAGREAQKSFRVDYRRLVVLGKAVPADSEQASLLVQLQRLADRSGVRFQAIDLGEATAGTAAAAPAPATTDTTTTGSTSDSTSTDSTTTASSGSAAPAEPAPASEASVATLPIGASVGPAGLPAMPYELTFNGGFPEIADFMARLDGMVHMRDGLVDVRGRLLTVDGFTLTPIDTLSAVPELSAKLNVTTFLTPAEQGLTAGATPSGPPPSTATLASGAATAPAPTPTTAAATP